MFKTDHSLNKVFLVGIVGGLVITRTLNYPLYVLLPGQFVNGWERGDPMIGFIWEAVTVIITIALGFAAAMWIKAHTRTEGMMWGGIAGGVSGTMAYFGIGGAAAGVLGSGLMLQHGVAPAANEADMVRLLVEGVRGVLWWTHTSFWIALIAGSVLGGVGGAFVPPAEKVDRAETRTAAINILFVAVLVSSFSVIVTASVYSVLETSIYAAIAKNNLTLSPFPPIALTFALIMLTPMLLYFLPALALYRLIRNEVEGARLENDHSKLPAAMITAFACGALFVVLVALLILIMSRALLAPSSITLTTIIGLIANGVVAFLTTRLGFSIRAQIKGMPTMPAQPPADWNVMIRRSLSLTLGMMYVIVFGTMAIIPAPLALVLIVVQLIVPLSSYDKPVTADFTTPSIVNTLYAISGSAFSGVLIASAIGVVVMVLVLWGVGTVAIRLRAKTAA